MDLQARRRAAAAVVVAVACWFFTWFRRRVADARSITYGPLTERDQQRNHNLNYIHNSDDVHCVNLLRMRRAPFFQLCDLFRTRGLVTDNIHELIVPPSTNVDPKILGSRRWYPYFKDCICSIDGTQVLARVPRRMQAAFRGRKQCTTQNVLAVVSFDWRFTYVLAGWEGSAHDALILSDALARQDGLRVLLGKFYLVDVGYALRPGFLPRFRGTRYHLREYDTNRPQNHKELFNLRHSSLRVSVERAFGALKNRFRILDNKPFHPYKTQVKLVLACCILHNWILRYEEDEHVPSEESWTPNNNEVQHEDAPDSVAWGAQREAWAAAVWQNMGTSRV